MSVKPDDDRELLRKAQQGDAQAFGALYEKHAASIFRYLYAHLGDRLDAEDLTSDVFMKAWHTLPSYRERGVPFLAYLFRIARNRLIDYYRHNRHLLEISPEIEENQADTDPDPAESLLTRTGYQELSEVLGKLKDDYRTVLVLRIINQLSPEETAIVMRRSTGSVRVMQHRALEALRQVIETSERKSHEADHEDTKHRG
jgi:RNA polymerase sigma-70 factor (ECF subfamily)